MNENFIEDILKITNSKVFCLGDLMLDKYVIGSTNRISPEGPIPILDVKEEVQMLGGVGNVVRNLGTIGIKTYLVALVGDDKEGIEINKRINKKNIVKKIIKDKNRPSTVKIRFIANNQQILRVDQENMAPVNSVLEKKIINYSKRMILSSDAVILSDYGKGLLTDNIIKTIINFSKKHNKPVVLDPKNSNFKKYTGATIITPNTNELEKAVNKKLNSEFEIITASKQLIKKYKFKYVLVTRGKYGMILVSSDMKVLNLKTEAKEIYDVSGAGDTVVSFIAASLGCLLPIQKSIKIANTAAGIAVSKSGTSVVHLSELIFASDKRDFSSKLVNFQEGLKIVDFWKKKKHIVGFTNGCFDYLHPGHISLFKQAKKKCSKLIVAINSDNSVKKIKGPSRPKQNEKIRIKILEAINYVDLIILFSDKTPIRLIKKIKPNLLVKGSDYKEKQIVGAKEVKSYGGKVLRAKILKDFSSSLVIDEILHSSF